MKAWHAVLVALAAAVTLTSVAAADTDGAKQRVAINLKILPESTFVLTPVRAGALKPDSGTISGNWRSVSCHAVMRKGQKVDVCNAVVWTLEGKQGSLTIRERNEWVAVSNENAPGVDFPPGVAVGTWKVVRGTGQYAGITGSGRSGHAGLGAQWFARQEGFLTVP